MARGSDFNGLPGQQHNTGGTVPVKSEAKSARTDFQYGKDLRAAYDLFNRWYQDGFRQSSQGIAYFITGGIYITVILELVNDISNRYVKLVELRSNIHGSWL